MIKRATNECVSQKRTILYLGGTQRKPVYLKDQTTQVLLIEVIGTIKINAENILQENITTTNRTFPSLCNQSAEDSEAGEDGASPYDSGPRQRAC